MCRWYCGLPWLLGLGLAAASTTVPFIITQPLAARHQALLERDAKLIDGIAAQRLDEILDPLFSAYQQRLPDFVAWAFQWRTSYALLRRGVMNALSSPFTDPEQSRTLDGAWDDMISAQFTALVLQPEGGEIALRQAHDRWLRALRPTLDAVITDTLLTAAMLRGKELASPLPGPFVESAPPLDTRWMAAIGDASDPIKKRVARPLLTRLTIRPPVAAAVTTAGEAIGGAGELALLGSLSGMVMTITGFLSIDYMLSRADAAIHQRALVDELGRVLDSEREILRRVWLDHLHVEVDRHLRQAHLQADDPTISSTTHP